MLLLLLLLPQLSADTRCVCVTSTEVSHGTRTKASAAACFGPDWRETRDTTTPNFALLHIWRSMLSVEQG